MNIPNEIREAVLKAEANRKHAQARRLRCHKILGEMSKHHAHDQDGNCIVRNWSNEDAKGNWRKFH